MSPRDRIRARPVDFTVFLAIATLSFGLLSHAMAITNDIWMHELWSAFFAASALANLLVFIGLTDWFLVPAAGTACGGFLARPIGVCVQWMQHIPVYHAYTVIVFNTFFAIVLAFTYRRMAAALGRLG